MDPITTPSITSAADWDTFWRRMIREYDMECIAAHTQPPGTVSCWGCFHPVPYDSTIDGYCCDCLMRE